MFGHLAVTAGALLIESCVGYPDALFRTARHPVVWVGALLAWLDTGLNRDTDPAWHRRLLGAAGLAIVLAATVAVAAALQAAFATRNGQPVLALLASTLLASRSLYTHVRDVADALEAGGLESGRAAVGKIVGRNPLMLDEAGVVRAAIESLAENFSDGVVAPALWCALLGLPGVAAYKAINTADSMIGHRTPRHAAFGWAAARLDDGVNLPASRLAAFWLMLAALLHPRTHAGPAGRTVWRDASKHRSPNAGWPEAAMAGALGLRLAGPRIYGSARIEDAWMGDGRADATVADLRLALSIYRLACGLQIACVILVLIASGSAYG